MQPVCPEDNAGRNCDVYVTLREGHQATLDAKPNRSQPFVMGTKGQIMGKNSGVLLFLLRVKRPPRK